MDIWQLYVFCNVIEFKSFSKAGEAVRLSQPTVSSHIKDLENYFGIQLIDRLSKKAVPTKAGELLFQYAKQIIALKDETESAMAEYQGIIKGRLEIGGSTIPGVYLLPQIVGKFKYRYPQVDISLTIDDTDKIVQATINGDLELGIVGASYDDGSVLQNELIDDEMCLVVPANHKFCRKTKIKISELTREPFILREKGSGTLRSIKHSFIKSGYHIEDLNVVAEIGSTEAVIQAVKGGVGISIISKIAVKENLKSGLLAALSIEGVDLKRTLFITRHKQRSVSPLSKAFIEFLKKEMGQ
jgi:DNA-binding transcriptional LysR family regulator